MPGLTIETQPDGSVLVAPATQPLDPQSAERFQDMEQAMAAVSQVLDPDEDGAGETPKGKSAMPEESEEEERGEAPPPGSDSLMPTPEAEMEDDMAKGYGRAKKGL